MNDINNNEIVLKVEGKSIKPYIFFLVIILATMMQVLSSTGNDSKSVIVTLYFSIVLLVVAISKIGFLGVISSLVSSLVFSLAIGQDWQNIITSVIANTIQAFIIYLVFKFSKLKNLETNRDISIFKILILTLGLAYIVLSLVLINNYISSSIIVGLLMIIYVYYAIKNKNSKLLIYLFLIAIVPNLVGALTGSINFVDGVVTFENYFKDFFVWFTSNSILLLSVGYFILEFIGDKFNIEYSNDNILHIKFSTILFYFSTILWNVLIYILYYFGWLNNNIESYFFPWFVGNLFFIANLYMSKYKEINHEDKDEEVFKWYEGRSIVAENNTQMLVAIISFLLPICAQLLGTITYSISILFILNITAAIISIGLIWIPKNKVKYMSTIKHIKTIFHLFTLSLLLLNIVLIINESIGL